MTQYDESEFIHSTSAKLTISESGDVSSAGADDECSAWLSTFEGSECSSIGAVAGVAASWDGAML
jgi:hypothetical protein